MEQSTNQMILDALMKEARADLAADLAEEPARIILVDAGAAILRDNLAALDVDTADPEHLRVVTASFFTALALQTDLLFRDRTRTKEERELIRVFLSEMYEVIRRIAAHLSNNTTVSLKEMPEL